MALIQFVNNYQDLSTDKGYQFKFNCDKCGNGYMSQYQPSYIGAAGSVLRAAGSIFGGWASSAGHSAYEMQRAVGGKAHDSALQTAVQEGKQHFHQCSRCGKWVCPEACWNDKANQCETCAPRFDEELASAQAQAKAYALKNQMQDAAMKYNYASEVDMSPESQTASSQYVKPSGPDVIACFACSYPMSPNAKFCPECGVQSENVKPKCPKCWAEMDVTTKFCQECGTGVR